MQALLLLLLLSGAAAAGAAAASPSSASSLADAASMSQRSTHKRMELTRYLNSHPLHPKPSSTPKPKPETVSLDP